MKRAYHVLTAALAITASLLSACAADEGDILPDRIENIMAMDEIPETSESGKTADAAYSPRMLMGVWNRTELTSQAASIDVPATDGTEDFWTVECLPDRFIFEYPGRGAADDEESMWLGRGNLYGLQGRFCRTDAGGKILDEKVSFYNVADISGNTLAMGFTGLAADEVDWSQDVTVGDITEVDYEISFEGYELTLTYGGAEAVYVPATCLDGNLTKALDGFAGSCDDLKHPDWHFSDLIMNGDGTGSAVTVYGETGLTITEGKNGSLSFKTDHGETFTYDNYWYSDTCLTLAAGENRLMYQDRFQWTPDSDYQRNFITYHLLYNNDVLEAGNRDLNNPLGSPVARFSRAGGRTDSDLDGTMVPSGGVTEPFEITFKSDTFRLRAMNPTDTEIALKDCIVVWYAYDSEGIMRRTDYSDATIGFSCGETKESLLRRYDSFAETDENTLCAMNNWYKSFDESDFSDYNAHLILHSDDIELLVLDFEDDRLANVTACLPSMLYYDLEYQVPVAELLVLDRDDAEETAMARDALADALAGTVLPDKIVRSDEGCAFGISRDDLFDYGSLELSESGKKLLDETMEALVAAVPENEVIGSVEAAAYFRFESENHAFSKPYAEAVAKYLSGKKNGLSDSVREALKSKVTAGGYGATDYLANPVFDGDTHMEIRFLLKPINREEKMYEDTPVVKREATYDYMTVSETVVGRQIAAFAARYAGTYAGQNYTNEGLGIRWILPNTWYVYDDADLRNYNGGTADKFLLAGKPVYIFAATDEENMVDIRLHPFDVGSDYAARAEDCARSLFDSYEAICKGNYSEVEVAFEEDSFGGGKTWSGTFTFKANGRTFCRKQYYLVREDAVVVVSVTSEENPQDLEGLGF